MNNVVKGDLFYDESVVREYKTRVKEFKLTEELMEWFEEEERSIKEITEKRTITQQEEDKKKHIAMIKGEYTKLCYFN